MKHHVRLVSIALLVGGMSLSPLQRATFHRDPHDLDKMSTKELDADLEAELDDIYVGHSKTELVELGELKAEIMHALSDDGDSGLASAISEEDLEAEMAEDGTTLPDVVDRALHAVDQATGPRARHQLFAYASLHTPRDAFRTTRQLAVKETKAEIIQAIQAVKR